MTWQCIGPRNIGGCMFGIAIDPASDRQIFAVSASGGCWHLRYDVRAFPESDRVSWNSLFPGIDLPTFYVAASQWTPLTDRLPLLYMTAMALSERNPQVLYCVSGHYNGEWPTQVWRSDDRGRSWTDRGTPDPPDFGTAYRLVLDPDDADRLYVAAKTGLWRSVDGGTSWQRIYDAVAYDVALDPDDAAVIYAGIEDIGVIKALNARSRSRGTVATRARLAWKTVLAWSQAAAPSSSTIRISLGAGDTKQRTVAAKLAEEVFVSHDAGLAWSSQGKHGGAGQGDWDHVVAADPFDRDIMLAGAQDLFRTDDGGKNWKQVAGYKAATHPDQQFVVFDRRQRGVTYLANDGGVWGSRDAGATWFDLNAGLVTAELFHVGISGDAVMGDMYHHGLVGSADVASPTWGVLEGGSWEFADVYGDPVRAGRFFVFHSKLGLRRLYRVWIPVVESKIFPPSIAIRYEELQFGSFDVEIGNFKPKCIAFHDRAASNTIIVGAEDGNVMRALDGDVATPTWSPEAGLVGGHAIVGLSASSSNPDRFYAIAADGTVYAKDDVNSDAPWVMRGKAHPDVMDLAVNAADAERLYALHENGLETSADGGVNWAWINGSGADGLPTRGLKSVFAHPLQSTQVIVGAVGGVFATIDQGATWRRFDRGLPNAEIKQVFMAKGTLYAATVGRGLWRRNLYTRSESAAIEQPFEWFDPRWELPVGRTRQE